MKQKQNKIIQILMRLVLKRNFISTKVWHIILIPINTETLLTLNKHALDCGCGSILCTFATDPAHLSRD